ncbi:hypothetical protein AB0D54_18895 [Streptomyces xanthophaeus]|uniref:hypothetical protein n=1 Tax=Streptomyces xanthophaeus TaxID=67385 RepID=UPI003415E127
MVQRTARFTAAAAPLPVIGEGDDFESFALVAQNGRLAALWADPGAGADRPATLYAAPLTFVAWGQPLFGAFPQYKAEAVEFLPGSAEAVLGADDENVGGYVRTMPFCGT